MATVTPHFRNILYRGFDPYREPLSVRFVSQGDRSIPDFSIKYVDGFTKGLICQSIAALCDKLEAKLQLKTVSIELFTNHGASCLSVCNQEFTEEDLDADDLAPLLRSLRFFKAKYTHMEHEEKHFYEALRPVLNLQCNHTC